MEETKQSASIGFPNFDRLWDANNPELTEKHLHDFTHQLDINDTRHKLCLAGLLTQIARSQGLQNRLPEANNTINKAEEVLSECSTQPLDEEMQHSLEVVKIRCLLERGRLLHLAKTPSQARPLLLRALERSLTIAEDHHAVDAAQMMSVIELPKMKHPWILKAIHIAKKSDSELARRYLSSFHISLGQNYFETHRYEKALEIFKTAFEYADSENNFKESVAAKCQIGKCLRVLKRIDEALEVQEILLADLDRTAKKDGYVYEELAECFLLLHQKEKAKEYFASAYAELSKEQWLKDNEPDRLDRLKKFGKVK